MNADIQGKATEYAKGLICSYTAAEVSVWTGKEQEQTQKKDRIKVFGGESPDSFFFFLFF